MENPVISMPLCVKSFNIPTECLAVAGSIIRKSDLGLSSSFQAQIIQLDLNKKHENELLLEKHRMVLKKTINDLESEFINQLSVTVKNLKEKNNEYLNSMKSVCASVCSETLQTIGAQMSSEEKVNILVHDAIVKFGGMDNCKIIVPPNCSSCLQKEERMEGWTIEEDYTLSPDEIIVKVDFGNIRGDFDASFKKHIEGLILL